MSFYCFDGTLGALICVWEGQADGFVLSGTESEAWEATWRLRYFGFLYWLCAR
jgi:hypothetical protein